MTDVTAAADRLREICDKEPLRALRWDNYGNVRLAEETTADIRTVLDALPAWRAKPTCPGCYIGLHDWHDAYEFTEDDMEWDGELLYGPIPIPAAPEGK